MLPEGRIMLRYWALVPGKYDHGVCPFQEMASNFAEAAEDASKYRITTVFKLNAFFM